MKLKSLIAIATLLVGTASALAFGPPRNYYRALAMAADSVWAASLDWSSDESQAVSDVLADCKRLSNNPDTCQAASAGGRYAAVFAVQCWHSDGRGQFFIQQNNNWVRNFSSYSQPYKYELDESFLLEQIRAHRLQRSQCQLLVAITRDGGYDYQNKRSF